MGGLRERLLEIRAAASPSRINEAIHANQNDAERILKLLPDEVLARTETRSGDIKVQKRNRFLKGIQNLIEKGFSLSQIVQMDDVCVDNQGRINEVRLEAIIRGDFDD